MSKASQGRGRGTSTLAGGTDPAETKAATVNSPAGKGTNPFRGGEVNMQLKGKAAPRAGSFHPPWVPYNVQKTLNQMFEPQ